MASTYGTSASKYRKPKGYYAAIVTQVDGEDVYVKVPRLSDTFEHGPIPYAGAVPAVGDDVFVGFLADDPDTLMAVFPGGSGGGAIEDTYYIVSEGYERDELELMADYVVTNESGYDATEIFQSVVDLLGVAGYGRILLSRGLFNLSSPVVGWIDGFTIQGAGMDDTWVEASGDMGPAYDTYGASGMLEIGGTGLYRDLYIFGDWDTYLPPPNFGSHALVHVRSWSLGGTTFNNVYLEAIGAANRYPAPEFDSLIACSTSLDVTIINCQMYSYDGACVTGGVIRVDSSYMSASVFAVYADDTAMLVSSRLTAYAGIVVYAGSIVANGCYFRMSASDDVDNSHCISSYKGRVVINGCSLYTTGPGYPTDDPESYCIFARDSYGLVARGNAFSGGTHSIVFEPFSDASSAVISANTFHYSLGAILADATVRSSSTYGAISVTGNMFREQGGTSFNAIEMREAEFSSNSVQIDGYSLYRSDSPWVAVRVDSVANVVISDNEMAE